MPTEPAPVTLAEIVRRSVRVVDPDDTQGLDDFLRRFEDADEPVGPGRADAVAREIAEGAGALDPQQEDPAVQMAAAVATYLSYRRGEVHDEPGEILLLAARAEFGDHPPPVVAGWLADAGLAP